MSPLWFSLAKPKGLTEMSIESSASIACPFAFLQKHSSPGIPAKLTSVLPFSHRKAPQKAEAH